jgi:hypothetical protein
VEAQLHLHMLGVPGPDGAPEGARIVSPGLTPEQVSALEASVYYGGPEDPSLPPPVAWSLQPLDAESAVLTRAQRVAAPELHTVRLVAHSVVFPRAAELGASGQLLELAADDSIFPEPPDRPPADPLSRPTPPAHSRLTEGFGTLLRLVRGERGPLAELLAATTSLGEEGGPLRAVVFALPGPAFRDDRELLRLLVGLLAAVPRRQRAGLGFATYQDSPSPRPLRVLAVPEAHRCVPRLVRSNGYVVFPHPAPHVRLLHPRILEYGLLAAELLTAGRFEEAQALAATFDLHGSAPTEHTQRQVTEHADLLRLARTPSVAGIVSWLDANPLPEDPERRRLLLEAVSRALTQESQQGRHGGGAQLLRTLGLRWTDPDWTAGLGDELGTALTAFVASWYASGGWAPVVALFGRVTAGDPWLRELLSIATAEAVAECLPAPGPDDEAILATIDAQFDALDRALPPARYLRWRIRTVGDEDGRVRAWLLRALRHPRAHDLLLALLRGFDSPRHAALALLLPAVVVPLAAHQPGLARDLVSELIEHYGPQTGGLVVLARAIEALLAVGAEALVVELAQVHLLPLGPTDETELALHRRLLESCGRGVAPERWDTVTAAALADAGPARGAILANLRRLWVAQLATPGRRGSAAVAATLRAIHEGLPGLAVDAGPYVAITLAGGPESAAGPAIDDLLLLSNRGGGDDRVRRFLGGLFGLFERLLPGERWRWQRALTAAARDRRRPASERATALWWLWSVGREAGLSDLARHAARTLLLENLLAALGESRFELLCRLLPSETGITREQLVVAAVEGALLTWTGQKTDSIPAGMFRHFTPQADSLARETYRRLVERFGEACLVLRESSVEDLRTLLDRVYVPRHWEVLVEVVRSLVARCPRLRGQLGALRRTTLGRRLPPQLLGAFESSLGQGSGRPVFLGGPE